MLSDGQWGRSRVRGRSWALLFSTLLLVVVVTIPGAGQTLDFQNFTVENGLSHNQVLSLYQDAEGELWLGTIAGGINRFNGTDFNYLTKDDGLSDNVVFAMASSPKGEVLVGTLNGLSIIRGNRIDTVGTSKGLPHQGVVSIMVAKDSTVWLGTYKGACILADDTVIAFKADSNLLNAIVYSIREGSGGSIWFCTLGNGLFRWDGKTMLQISKANGLRDNVVYDVLPMGKTDAWIFGGNTLYHLKGDTAEEIPVKVIPDPSHFFGYQRDRAGNLWIATEFGVLKFRDGVFTLLNKENGLVDNYIKKILQDREGNLWFASKTAGVSKLNSERFKLYHDGKVVSSLHKDAKGRMWLGTNKGFALWESDSLRHFNLRDRIDNVQVRGIAEDAKGDIYLATSAGLTIYDGKKVKTIKPEDGGFVDCYSILLEGTDVLLGTRGGLAKYENGKISALAAASQFKNYVFDGCKWKGDTWFAYENGLLHYDGNIFRNLRSKDGFTDGRTRSIVSGPDGRLWYGTNDGVFRWDGKQLVNYNENDGLLANTVHSLAFDAGGNLWVGQAKGLSKMVFDGDSLESVMRFSREQGFLGQDCNTNALMVDVDSVIWIGSANGLVAYDPRLDKGELFKPITRITELKLFSQTMDWSILADSITPSGLPIDLALPYDKNHLTFIFTGVSLTSAGSINYSYILEGFDDDWSPVTNNNEATYANLPPGNYTFKVRAGYGNEIWKNEAVEFSFRVKPPFYRTTWFYILCGLIVIGIAYSYYTIRRANVKITAQNIFIENQKDELEKKKDEIEKKNREMTDSINYASTIQSAILPSEDLWRKLLPDSFVFFQPKDIVSGDFYWMENRGSEVFFAAVDCTGHGVPGALMSIIGNNGLNQAVNEHRLMDPAIILNYLSMSVNESLRKSERSNYVKDGMDIALCRLNLKTRILNYAGAYNPLVIVRNGEAIVTKADRIAIGSMDNIGRTFQNHEIQLEQGDCLYIYSDGFADQFGGADGKKLKTAPMLKKLLEVSPLPMKEQVKVLRAFFMEWKGPLEQVDDICMIGVRV